MINYKQEINYMRRVIVIIASITTIIAGLIIYLHGEAGEYVDDYCVDDTGIVFIDPPPVINFYHQSFQDNAPGDRDKGGMLVDRDNHNYHDHRDPLINNYFYPHPGIPGTPLKKSCPPGGGGVPGGVNYISEPGHILFYLFFIIFYINHRTGAI